MKHTLTFQLIISIHVPTFKPNCFKWFFIQFNLQFNHPPASPCRSPGTCPARGRWSRRGPRPGRAARPRPWPAATSRTGSAFPAGSRGPAGWPATGWRPRCSSLLMKKINKFKFEQNWTTVLCEEAVKCISAHFDWPFVFLQVFICAQQSAYKRTYL